MYLSDWTFYKNGEGSEGSFADPNSDYWLFFAGNRVSYDEDYVINLLNPDVQEIIIDTLVSKANCGVWDGIMIDSIAEDGLKLVGVGDLPLRIRQEYKDAMIHVLREVRLRARDNFLILINAGPGKSPSFAPYVNGSYMECGREPHRVYNLDELRVIEETLLWNEENLRSPQINCLEGFGFPTERPNSPLNQKWMRIFTTLSLTHSDGYVLYNRGGFYIGEAHHDHIWYDFWNADLGRPVGGNKTKAQTYNDIDGIFIREFTNGWAVYNRSGTEQEISLIAQTTGVASGATSFRHVIADLDGEMYLKTGITADINGDGVVNVLDLVIVANALGKTNPDLNGDGVVNILDLVIVANAF